MVVKRYEFKSIPVGLISDIKTQSRDPKRVSLFIDGKFVVGFSTTLLMQFNLRKGQKICEKLADELDKAIAYEDTYKYLIRLLERREHAASELKIKCIKKGFKPKQIDEALEELQSRNLQNDQRYAEIFTRSKSQIGWGPEKIKLHLVKNGLSKEFITHALKPFQENSEETQERIHRLLDKRIRKWTGLDDRKLKEKLYRYLVQKGFHTSLILRSLDAFLCYVKSKQNS